MKKIDVTEGIKKCIELGMTKENLAQYLSTDIKGEVNPRLELLAQDFLNEDVKTYGYYATSFGISISRVSQLTNYIYRKIKYRINKREFELKMEEVKNSEELDAHILFYFEYGPLTARTVNCLMRAGVVSSKELYEMKYEDYCKIRNLGRKSHENIEQFKEIYKNNHLVKAD